MCVLVVDDDAAIRRVLVEALEDEGYPVIAAENGQDALDCLTAARSLPRLILLDLNMPVMNGWQFALAIQDHPVFVSIPIVLMSAGANLERAVRGLAIADALQKPIDIDRLLMTVARYCEDKARYA